MERTPLRWPLRLPAYVLNGSSVALGIAFVHLVLAALFGVPAAQLASGGAVAKAYAELFTKLGGVLLKGNAQTLHRSGQNWRVDTDEGPVDAKDAVVALGPWSDLVFGRLGYSIPLSVKRGYHLHLAARGNAVLNHPVLDADQGFVLVPMNRGIRLCTGVEFARRDAPPTPVQLQRALPRAHALFPLGEAVDAKPWMGARPCLPDMRPVM